MVGGCGCHDPIAFGHGYRCRRELGPDIVGGTRPDEPIGPPAMTSAFVPGEPVNSVRQWYNRVIEWAERFDRRYSELQQAHMELYGRPF